VQGWIAGLVLTALCSFLFAVSGGAAEKGGAPQLPKNWKFSLPEGDAAAGRETLRKMQCHECHRLPVADFPAPRSSGGLGPDLVPSYSRLPREFVAEAIINRHKHMTGTLEHYRGLEKVSSQMTDYGTIMTLRELIDIVEFLKHPDQK